MNILLVYESFCDSAAGVPYEVLNLAMALKREGHDILCIKGPHNRKPEIYQDAIDAGLLVKNFSWKKPHQLTAILRDFEPDVAHVFYAMIPMNIFVSRVLVKLSIPYIFEPHGSLNSQVFNMRFGGKRNGLHHKWKKKIFRWLADDYLIRNAMAYRAVSEAEAGILNAHGRYRTFVIPYAVSEEWYYFVTHVSRTRIQKYFFFLGRQDIYQKGLDLLLDAFEILNKNGYRKKYEALLAGPDVGGSIKALEERVADANLDNVKICEGLYGVEKENAFAQADIFLCPSRFEGVPKTVREAMARGIPSLVTRETNLADICLHDLAGMVVSADGRDIAAALGDYIDGKISLAPAADIIHASRKYNWKSIGNQLILVYEQVAGKRLD